MEYHDLVLSGKGTSLTILAGDRAYDTLVRNSARLRVSNGGYIENTTLLNSTIVSNGGIASATFLSGGTMLLLKGGIAEEVSVLRNARLSVSSGGVAVGLTVSSGNVNAVVCGGDEVTRVEGTNELGSFRLSNGVASNFRLNSTGQLTVSKGGVALDTTINFGGYLTVMSGGTASGIVQNANGFVRADVFGVGADPGTFVCGTNAHGAFLLSGGVASNFILYDGGAQNVSSGGTAFRTLVSGQRATYNIWSSGFASATSVFRNGIMNVYDHGSAADTVVSSGGSLAALGGARISGATISGTLLIDSGSTGEGELVGTARLHDVTIASEGVLNVVKNAIFEEGISIFGTLKVGTGITVADIFVSSGGSALVAGTLNVAGSSWNTSVGSGGTVNVSAGATLFNLATVSGARVNLDSEAVLAGTSFAIAENTIHCQGAALGMTASGGTILGLGADGSAYDLRFGSGVTVAGALVGDGGRICALSGSLLSGARISGGAIEILDAGARLEDTVIAAAGGALVLLPGMETGKRIYFDFSDAPAGGSIEGTINDFSLLSADTAICLVGTSDGGVYTVASEGSSELLIHCSPNGLYDNAIKAGERTLNAFDGMAHAFDAEGKNITASAFTVDAFDSASALDSAGTQIENDRAAIWTNFGAASGTVLDLVSSSFGGNAWLELDGTDLGGATLYGAAADFGGVVNLLATSGAVIGNLAAGAAAKGSVAGVKLTVDSATLGLSYAGGFGTVDGATETRIAGGSATKDFYAGALANYAKTGEKTSAGDIRLEIEDGTFSGNIYGAAAVKAGSADSVVHSAGDVSITVTGGNSIRGPKACLFAGGYATGSTAAKVYTAGSVTVDISGGNWGSACGGRGIFGGVFASQVTAEAADVAITISGGTMGNVYGGGWAQKGGTSKVGNVNITVAGGTIANIFGGGSTSTTQESGNGSTFAGDVTITVSGGDVTGDIFVRGQGISDSVTGSAAAVFTGDRDFSCGVWGYSCVGGLPSDATLNFTDYTGTFSGKIGGFSVVAFDGNTEMVLDSAVSGSAVEWNFDVASRDAGLADTVLLNWSAADFAADTVTLNLAATDTNEWSLVGAAADTAYSKFDVLVDGISILPETIALDEAIAEGDHAGWGFTVEDTVLKFKNLA